MSNPENGTVSTWRHQINARANTIRTQEKRTDCNIRRNWTGFLRFVLHQGERKPETAGIYPDGGECERGEIPADAVGGKSQAGYNHEMSYEDFTPEELALVDALSKRHPIAYGCLNIEIHFENGERTSTIISERRNIREKFRAKRDIINKNK